MPSFSVDGAEVSGEAFFTAMNEPDLMPAACPEGPKDGTHYNEWSNTDLLGGLDRLGGLDVGWQDGRPDFPDHHGGGGDVNHPISITPEIPTVPDVPIVYPDAPGTPETGNGDSFAGIIVDNLTVHESALGDGNPDPVPGTITSSGKMLIDAPDGLRSIIITDMLGEEHLVYRGRHARSWHH